jgi:lipid-binding SYLF domain-containing protein
MLDAVAVQFVMFVAWGSRMLAVLAMQRILGYMAHNMMMGWQVRVECVGAAAHVGADARVDDDDTCVLYYHCCGLYAGVG